MINLQCYLKKSEKTVSIILQLIYKCYLNVTKIMNKIQFLC